MPVTLDQINLLPFGYLCGADLAQFCPGQLLIKQYLSNPNSLQNGCSLAYAELESKLVNRYNIGLEIARLAPLQGTAIADITAGFLTSLIPDKLGGLYKTAPIVAFTGGGGAGATATSIIDANGVLTGFNITAPGAAYTSAPTPVLSGGLLPDPRAALLVKIGALIAVRNALGSMQNASEYLENLFKWADRTLKEIRDAQANLPLQPVATQGIDTTTGLPNPYPQSDAVLIPSSFNYIG